MFAAALLVVSAAAGAVAAVAGFGIGSLLTPLIALQTGTKLAVAIVSVPHAIGTFVRFVRLRRLVDRRLLWRFGLTSAAGGLAGALLHGVTSSRSLASVFGALLVLAGATQLTGRAWRFRGWVAWLAGGVSGFLGGLVGNQGGIRSAAMLGFDISRHAFVATATATALLVDAARMPVYAATQGAALAAAAGPMSIAVAGVVAGTLWGDRLLARIPEARFRALVGAAILALGVATLVRGRA
ncbi:MAG: TSUP family transporter [Acidobacteria bacterium]|nr:TSUP family transporter [Acidobacteriota bacterium]